MRLINADELEKAIHTFYDEHFKGLVPNELITYAQAVDDLIDNAPTVESDYELGYSEGVHDTERPKGDWIPVSERLPEEKNLPGCDYGFDFKEVLCTTIWGDVRAYKFGKPIGHDKPHFWLAGAIMDEYVIAWQPLPEPYKKGGKEE